MMIRILLIMMVPFMCLGQITPSGNSVNNGMNEPGNLEIMRKSPFNLDEIKVRWKKAALENCPGVPCVTTTVPGAPTGVSATAGNASASVAFTAPASNGGSVITGYTVTSSPGGITATGATLTINVTGLTNGTAYTFTVVATNTVGNSVASTASTAVTPVAPSTVPGAPTGVSAIAGNASASVAFTAPASNGGSVITGYTVTSSPGGITVTGATSPINVTGLTNGTAYTFTVVATNTVGNSVASTASTAVTPFNPCGSITTVLDGDGNSYQTVGIGTQCWTNTNLKVTQYNDGTAIPLNNTYTSGTVSTVWAGLTTGAYTIFGNEASSGANATNYGFLYNWYAAKGITTTGSTTYKNICPTGFHVPTDSDWNKLVKFIDSGADTSSTSSAQSSTAGTKLKKNDALLWATNTGTDDYGFSGLPGGVRSTDGSFLGIRDYTTFWSATENPAFSAFGAWQRSLVHANGNVNRGTSSKLFGFSIRCLKD